jgi:hypothetical protein
MTQHHKTLTSEKWAQYPLYKQMLMIGSEFSRMLHLKHNEDQKNCIERAYELIDLTVLDAKLGARKRELLLLREGLEDEYKGQINLQKIEQYYQYCLDFSKLNHGA